MKQELKKEVGKRLRQFREKAGFTQRRMSQHFDIGHANYSRIERGEIFPGLYVLNVLNRKFNLSLHWVVCGEGDMLIPDDEKNECINIENYSNDVKDLLLHMEKVPMIKHAVLSFFMEYKMKNEGLVKKVWDPAEDEARDDGRGTTEED